MIAALVLSGITRLIKVVVWFYFLPTTIRIALLGLQVKRLNFQRRRLQATSERLMREARDLADRAEK